jgi:phenylalanyl-tRNA synthetase beta chain
MKVSEQWLREWVNPRIDSDELVEQLTMAGLEVDGIEPVAGEFKGVVVAEIQQAEQHPDADKLRVCQVSNGAEIFQVVCGAANARAGIKVALAEVGAVLPGSFKIKKAKLRGVESHGMLCGADEIGLGEKSEGIMELPADAPIGADIRCYLKLEDNVIDIDLTPNRGDCLSIAGLAREVGVLNKVDVTTLVINEVPAVHSECHEVIVEADTDCPRYVGRVIKGVDVTVQTPLWMVERLRRSGIRSVDPVVDVTNYVLLELGQPMHAFDKDKLQGPVRIRTASVGEKLTLLDEQEVALTVGTLLIADDSGPLAMAGVMGGAATGVSSQTKNIFLESAFFKPTTIAGKARSYGLHTDSSHRFERGVDFVLQRQAVERATALLLAITGGAAGPIIEVVCEEKLPQWHVVSLREARVKSLLALDIGAEEIVDILVRLGLGVKEVASGEWSVSVPSYRFDIAIEADLIEELARIYGYNRLPVCAPTATLTPKPSNEAKVSLKNLRRVLLARSYNEAITYSFVDPKMQRHFDPSEQVIALANPISADMSVMRTSLWPGLAQALQYNQNRQQQRVRLFESGLTFKRGESGIEQDAKIGGIIAGGRAAENWLEKHESVDFYDVKGDVETLLAMGGSAQDFSFRSKTHHALHPGQSAAIFRSEEEIGYVGALHPVIEAALGLNGPVYLFEVALSSIEQGRTASFTELSKFPEVRRDLAILVASATELSAIIDVIKASAGEYLTDVCLFDLYDGQGVEPGQKSLALGLTWQHASRTLNDQEISVVIDCIINNLEKQFSAKLRG